MDLPLTYAGIDYFDRTRALRSGAVKPQGIDFRYIALPPGDLFRRVAKLTEFDAAEMSFSTYVNLRDAGDDRYVAIPVFPSRNFRHGYIFVNATAGVSTPSDLRGRKVGLPQYQMTAAVWQRAFLEHDYSVRPGDIQWFEGGLRTPGFVERNPIEPPAGVSLDRIAEDRTLEEMLVAGELDALFSANRPTALLDGSGRVARLFPDWVAVEQDYFERTRLYPIMHVVVLRRSLYEANPWIAGSLLTAFIEDTLAGWRRLNETGALAAMLPWLPRELEDVLGCFGDSAPWVHGFRENFETVSALCRYHHEQGLSSREWTPQELLAQETHEPPLTAEATKYQQWQPQSA
jgi:4,5-dihydroxyphthalate decarboxylase